MASNPYVSQFGDSELVGNQDIKLDASSFYTPTSVPFPSSNLQQQHLQQQQQQQQQQLQQSPEQEQFYTHTVSPAFGNFNNSFISTPSHSPPPLEPDMNTYMGAGGYSQLANNGQYGDYYSTSIYPSQAYSVPRSEDINLMLMRSYNLSTQHSEYPHSGSTVGHGLLIDNGDWYGRRSSLSRSPSHLSTRDVAACSAKDEGDETGAAGGAEMEDSKVELPYAKLIHKALMEAPNHAMSLQEIYKWFMENTEKGSSTGTGWRNSIRHNLSMNQAFRKSDKNSINANGDHSDGAPKKSSEWVLEPWAVTDGVTPTTRYRQKISKKAANRDQASINTSRQSAGKKGGNMAGRTKALRSMQSRHASSHANSPASREASTPSDIERERYAERDGYNGRFKRQCTEAFIRGSPPMEDPITPTTSMANGPYYYGGSSHGYYDDPVKEPEYDLSQVQGVYPSNLYNNSSIFSHDALPQRFDINGRDYNLLEGTLYD